MLLYDSKNLIYYFTYDSNLKINSKDNDSLELVYKRHLYGIHESWNVFRPFPNKEEWENVL